MKWDLVKVLSVILVVLLILNMTLFAMKKLNGWLFWLTVILAAAYAFWILPRLKNVEKGNKGKPDNSLKNKGKRK